MVIQKYQKFWASIDVLYLEKKGRRAWHNLITTLSKDA